MLETQAEPSKYWVDEQVAALAHFAESGMPKSVLNCVPAPESQTFACEDTFAHVCFSDSMRAWSASVRTHERSPLLFHTCSRCPEGGTGEGGITEGGTSEAPHPYTGAVAHEFNAPPAVRYSIIDGLKQFPLESGARHPLPYRSQLVVVRYWSSRTGGL